MSISQFDVRHKHACLNELQRCRIILPYMQLQLAANSELSNNTIINALQMHTPRNIVKHPCAHAPGGAGIAAHCGKMHSVTRAMKGNTDRRHERCQ